ncbi:MAG: 5-deoxy-glucuronate isomerase [Terrisporobacter sp.]|uniref:5-deoxy-glucuronate isomerase n=1 Tax=Terrisporobacter sp. TaxID=1965305 RepID=UPI002FCBE30A
MLERMGSLKSGKNILTEVNGRHSNMLMDISVEKMLSGECLKFLNENKEMAILLIDGEVTFKWENEEEIFKRTSVFDDEPTCLHVCKGIRVEIKAMSDVEILVQLTENKEVFESKLYSSEDTRTDIFGEGVWNDVARRAVRTVFDYDNAPYSNMVMGEVITYPGKWSSYIPHHHEQPEVYYYKFDKPQGFGFSLIGEDAYKIVDNSFSAIPGGLVHPQTSAPGYAMYYCWMIRHFEKNPWTERVDLEEHKWLLEKDVKIWPEI